MSIGVTKGPRAEPNLTLDVLYGYKHNTTQFILKLFDLYDLSHLLRTTPDRSKTALIDLLITAVSDGPPGGFPPKAGFNLELAPTERKKPTASRKKSTAPAAASPPQLPPVGMGQPEGQATEPAASPAVVVASNKNKATSPGSNKVKGTGKASLRNKREADRKATVLRSEQEEATKIRNSVNREQHDKRCRELGAQFLEYSVTNNDDVSLRAKSLHKIVLGAVSRPAPRDTDDQEYVDELPISAADLEREQVSNATAELESGAPQYISRALRKLEAAGLVALNAASSALIAALYPKEQAPDTSQARRTPPKKFAFTADQVGALVLAKPRRTGADANNHSFRELQDLLRYDNPDVSSGTLAGITAIVNDLANGLFNSSNEGEVLALCDELRIRRGVAIKKPNGKPRPIGIGSIFIGIATTLILRSEETKAEVSAAVGPFQLGVNVSGGVEAVPNIIRAFFINQPHGAVAKLDVKNAFNSVRREKVLEAMERIPSLAGICFLNYAKHSKVIFEDKDSAISLSIPSESGVAQGAPEGTSVFAAVLSPAIQTTLAAHPSVNCVCIADDIHLLGPLPDVLAALGTLKPKLLELGLELEAEKSKIICAAEGAAQTILESATPISLVDGFVTTGTPVGSTESVVTSLSSTFDGFIRLIRLVQRVLMEVRSTPSSTKRSATASDVYKLVRWCLAPAKTSFLLRTVPTALVLPQAKRYDDALFDLCADLLRIPAIDDLRDRNSAAHAALRSRLVLGQKLGGLQLSSAAEAAEASRVGNLFLTLHLVVKFLRLGEDEALIKRHVPELDAALSAAPATKAFSEASAITLSQNPMHRVSAAINALKGHAQKDRALALAADVHQRAWIRSCGGDGGAWLLAHRSWRKDLQLSDAEYTALLRTRAGLSPVQSYDFSGVCAHCGTQAKGKLEGNFLHALTCEHHGTGCPAALRANRHRLVARTGLRPAINHIHRVGGHDYVIPINEPQGNHFWDINPNRAPGEGADRPRGDWVVVDKSGFSAVCDLVISHTNATSPRTLGSDRADGLAAAVAYNEKIDLYSKLFVIKPAKSFVPISIETGGRMHAASKKYLQTICCRLVGGDPKNWNKKDQSLYNSSIRHLMDSVSLALAKAVAHALIRFPPSKRVEEVVQAQAAAPLQQ